MQTTDMNNAIFYKTKGAESKYIYGWKRNKGTWEKDLEPTEQLSVMRTEKKLNQ